MNLSLAALVTLAATSWAAPVWAALAPPSEDAKAKAAEAAAKSAHSAKVEAYQLCKSMDKVAAEYYATAKKAGTQVKPPEATPPCVDPGPFVYTPPAPASATAAAPAAPAAPVATAAPASK